MKRVDEILLDIVFWTAIILFMIYYLEIKVV